MNAVIAVIKMLIFATITLLVVPLQIAFKTLSRNDKNFIIPKLWHSTVCKIFGIKIDTVGTPATHDQTLFMSNHLSYLDIPVLGSTFQNASFVAKKDVEGWPIFGFLAKLQNTAFIDRSPSKIETERDKIAGRVAKGHTLILFPEATSGDGVIVKPFKSSLFSLAENTNIQIQPVTITLITANGIAPETLEQRRIYTWPLEDDIEMPAHLWRFAKSSGAHLRITYHDPINPADYDNRKALAKACENSVSMGLK